MKKKKWGLIFLVVIMFMLVACGSDKSSSEKNYATKEESAVSEDRGDGFQKSENKIYSENVGNNTEATQKKQQPKIIRNAYLEMETLYFDKILLKVDEEVKRVNGFIEESKSSGKKINAYGENYNRNAYFKIRVPKDKYDIFLKEIGELGNVVNTNESTEDITSRYFDTEAHLNTKRIQEERLLEILKKAEKIEDVIKLEKALADVRYEIESLTTSLRKWDNLVEYTTFTIEIKEVEKETIIKKIPKTLGQKISTNFINSLGRLKEVLEYLIIIIISIIPFVIVFGGIGFIVYLIMKKHNTRKKK